MTRTALLPVLLLVLILGLDEPASTGEFRRADSQKRVPYLQERLHSKRWQVRYSLLGDLDGIDETSKRSLEVLVKDGNNKVANQALVRYLISFVNVDKKLFDPKTFAPGAYPVTVLPEENPRRALVEYCLGRREIPPAGRFANGWGRPLAVLRVENRDDAELARSLTVVGVRGEPEDAKALYPFLESANEYVALEAAKAVIRLGGKTKGAEALRRLAGRDVTKDLHYVTQALEALRQIDDPEFRQTTLEILARVRKNADVIQPNWLNSFLFLAAEAQEDVWE